MAYMIAYILILVGIVAGNLEVSLCPAGDCESCLTLDGCTWCYGHVELITGIISWGYCYKQNDNDDEWCILDSGMIIEDSCSEIRNITSENVTTPSGDLFHDEICPFNSCGMCTNSAGCSWCHVPSFDIYTCLSDPLLYELNAQCRHNCDQTAVDQNCEHIECSSCLSETGCRWCSQSIHGKSNYSYGYCVPSNHSCEISNCTTCTQNITVPVPSKSEYGLIADPFEDPCTRKTTCSSCISNECGWCKGKGGWGECRGKTTKKNGEYGKPFCDREGGFWLSYNCEPSLAEVLFLLQNYVSADFQKSLQQLETDASFYPIGFDSVHIVQKLPYFLQVNFFSMEVPVEYSSYYCYTFTELIQSMVPVYNRKVNCTMIIIDDDSYLTQIFIYSRNSSSSGNVFNLNIGLICFEFLFLFFYVIFL